MLSSGAQFEFEGYLVDADRWQVRWRDEPIALNQKTFALLLYLIEHRGRVVGKDELMRTLWPDLIVEEGNVTQQIFLLRSALSRHASNAKIVETVARRGYRFAVRVEALVPPQLETQTLSVHQSRSVTTLDICEEIEDDPTPWTAQPRVVSRQRTAIAALACLLFGVGGYQLRGLQDRAADTAHVMHAHVVQQADGR